MPFDELSAQMTAAGVPLAAEHVAALWLAATERTIAADEVILEEGTASETLYIVRDGELAISIASGAELGRCRAGSLVGEVSLLDRGPASASVRATRPTRVLALDHAGFATLQHHHPRSPRSRTHGLSFVLSYLSSSEISPAQSAGGGVAWSARALLASNV